MSQTDQPAGTPDPGQPTPSDPSITDAPAPPPPPAPVTSIHGGMNPLDGNPKIHISS